MNEFEYRITEKVYKPIQNKLPSRRWDNQGWIYSGRFFGWVNASFRRWV